MNGQLNGFLFLVAGLGAALVGGWVGLPLFLYQSVEQPLQFSHETHTGEAVGMACSDCHGFLPDGRFAGVPGTELCTNCHQEPVGESPEERRLVEEYVLPNREIPWLVRSRQPDHVHFSHAEHVTLARLRCEMCHGPHGQSSESRALEVNRLSGYSRDIWGRSITRLRRDSWEGKKMSDCSACHEAMGVRESCLDCHK